MAADPFNREFWCDVCEEWFPETAHHEAFSYSGKAGFHGQFMTAERAREAQ